MKKIDWQMFWLKLISIIVIGVIGGVIWFFLLNFFIYTIIGIGLIVLLLTFRL